MELGEPENVELRLDDDGVKRWYLSTREGWQVCGVDDGRKLIMSAHLYEAGTTLTLVEPINDAKDGY